MGETRNSYCVNVRSSPALNLASFFVSLSVSKAQRKGKSACRIMKQPAISQFPGRHFQVLTITTAEFPKFLMKIQVSLTVYISAVKVSCAQFPARLMLYPLRAICPQHRELRLKHFCHKF